VPMTPDEPVAPPPSSQAKNSRTQSPATVAGAVMILVGALQIPTGIGVFATSHSSCVVVETQVASCSGGAPGKVVGVAMVGGGAAILAGVPILVLAARRPDVDKNAPKLSPRLSLSPRGGALAFSF